MKKKTDPHIVDLKAHILKTTDTIRVVIDSKPHVTDEMKARYDADRLEFDEIINKTALWDGYLSWIKGRVDNALMKATQIDVRPSVPMANAYYPGQVTKVLRMVIEARPPEKTDKAAERLPEGHRDKKCSFCHKFIYRFDKHKNRIRPNKETGDCPTCKKYRALLQKERTDMQKKSDKKAARRKAKENRGKPDPKYTKAMEARKKALREKEGHPSREERRKSRGF